MDKNQKLSSLQSLIHKMKTSPQSLSQLDNEIKQIISQDNMPEFIELIQLEQQEIYILIILEQKVEFIFKQGNNINNINNILLNILEFLSKVEYKNEISFKKIANIYSLLGIYGWPLIYCEFFDNILSLIGGQQQNPKEILLGFQIFENFLFKLKFSLEITEKRRHELKQALDKLSDLYMPILYNNLINNNLNNNYTTNSLKIIELLVGITKIDLNKILLLEFPNFVGSIYLSILEETEIVKEPVNYKRLKYNIENYTLNINTNNTNMNICCVPICELLLKLNMKNHNYFYAALFDDTFELSLKYWTQNLEIVNFDIATKILNSYNNVEDHLKTEIFEFFVKVSKKLQNVNKEILNSVTINNIINKKILVQLLKNITDRPSITSPNYFIRAFNLEQLNDKTCVNFIPYLIQDAEDLKITLKIVDKFDLNEEEYRAVYEIYSNIKNSDEIKAKCLIKLNNVIQLSLTTDNLKLFYYFIRENYININSPNSFYEKNFTEEFYGFFLKTTNFLHTFEILSLLAKRGEINKQIFELIFNKIGFFSELEVKEFIDVLKSFSFRNLFYEQLTKKLYELSEKTDDFELIEKINRKFINLLINDSETEILIELLQIDYFNSTKQILTYIKSKCLTNINNNNTNINNNKIEKLIFFLFNKYNSAFYFDLQPLMILIFVKCLKLTNTETVFANYKSDNLEQLKKCCQFLPEKKAKVMMKEYLKDIKAESITKNEVKQKVGEQKFMGEKEVDNNDFNLF